MIRLDVKEYCHTCPGFKAVVCKSNNSNPHSDVIIRCKFRGRCENIKHFLEREKEKGSGDTNGLDD